MTLENFNLNKIFQQALKNGGEFAELFEEHSQASQIAREGKRFEKIAHGIEAGIGLRILHQGKTAYGYTNELNEASLLKLAEELATAIKAKAFETNISFEEQKPLWQENIQTEAQSIGLPSKSRLVTAVDQNAWEQSSKICQVTTVLREHHRNITIANSLGEICHDKQNYLTLICQAVAQSGDIIQTGYEPLGGSGGWELLQEDQAVHIGKVAGQRAVQLLSAPLAPAGTMPVILAAEAGGTMVHEAVGHGLEADLACEGLSVYQDQLGKSVASKLITVIDDPSISQKRGSFRFDDEGTPAKRNVLIENGMLKNYMYNRLYAMKDDVASTGNGRRQSYKNRPICRMTNTMIAPGKDDPESILKSVDEGLLVTRMGSGQVNTVNGDFVFEVSEGFQIKNGKADHMVRGATLTGNGPEVLKQIDLVGSDLGYGMGTCGKEGQGVPVADAQPTLRIPKLIVGGQSK